MNVFKQPRGMALLGLALDGGRLEGVVVRRTNGSVEVKKSFAASLSLDLLTHDPELTGREIRKHLDSAGITERRCVMCLPLSWVMTLAIKQPELAGPDLESFLQIEAERGFPYAPEALILAKSGYRTPGGESYITWVAVPRDHVSRLEQVLKAAKLKPVSFSLGMVSLPLGGARPDEGIVALMPGESSIGLQIRCGGGVPVLRAIEGAYEQDGGERRIQADQVAREIRITLGQLPPDVRDSMRRLRVFGRSDEADELAEQLRSREESLGIHTEQVAQYAPGDFGVQIPEGTSVSPALSLALGRLTGRVSGFEFLPPRVSAWKQVTGRYSSGKLAWAGATAGGIVLAILLVFLIQQWQLARWKNRWNAISARVKELEKTQQQIKQFRPWFDDSFRSLSILRRLAEAFPEDGAVSAKTVEIREASTVICSGTARDNQALLRTLDKLRGVKEIGNTVQVDQIRGRSPLQYLFNFRWTERGGQ
jgi:hypothetical protein